MEQTSTTDVAVNGKGVFTIRYRYRQNQDTPNIFADINAYDLARLIEALEMPNYRATGLKFQALLTMESGLQVTEYINFSEEIMEASPTQLREIGDRQQDNN